MIRPGMLSQAQERALACIQAQETACKQAQTRQSGPEFHKSHSQDPLSLSGKAEGLRPVLHPELFLVVLDMCRHPYLLCQLDMQRE
jgi:hypothetical protein